MEQKSLWRVREVAAECDVHEMTVRRWISAGRLEAVRLGDGRSPIRVPASSLHHFLENATSRAARRDHVTAASPAAATARPSSAGAEAA